MIIDCFMWSYEREAVGLRLEVLKDIVDAHVAVQATNTFRGQDRIVQKLDSNNHNVTEIIVTIPDGLNPWESEKWLREEVFNQAVKLFGTKDTVYIVSDGDEIPNPTAIQDYINKPHPLRLMTDYRNFYANWRATEHVLEHQPTIGTYRDYIKVGGAGNARWHASWEKSKEWGWHLSSLGDTSIHKLETFAHTEYDTEEYKRNLDKVKSEMKDFLGRFDLEITDDIPPHTPNHLLSNKV